MSNNVKEENESKKYYNSNIYKDSNPEQVFNYESFYNSLGEQYASDSR